MALRTEVTGDIPDVTDDRISPSNPTYDWKRPFCKHCNTSATKKL